MIGSLLNSSSIPVLQEVLSFTEARHTVLAGNVANVHTPGYRSRDLSVGSFQEALKKSIAAEKLDDYVSPGRGMSPRQEAQGEAKAAMQTLLYHDDTNIDIERQVTEISKNQFMHNMAVSIMTSQFKLLETSISERV